MSATPIEVDGQGLQNLLDPDVVNRLVAPDLQLLEDSYATAAGFRMAGSCTIQTETGAEPFQVRS